MVHEVFTVVGYVAASLTIIYAIRAIWRRFRTESATLHTYRCSNDRYAYHWVVKKNGRPVQRQGCGSTKAEMESRQYDSPRAAEAAARHIFERRWRLELGAVDASPDETPESAEKEPPNFVQLAANRGVAGERARTAAELRSRAEVGHPADEGRPALRGGGPDSPDRARR